MMTKPVISNKITEKRKKWSTFEELNATNDSLDDAVCILDDLKVLITQLPDKLTISLERADALQEGVMILEANLDKFMGSTGLHLEETESKLDELQKILLHEETCDMQRFSKLVSEVKYSQKLADTLISNAEEEIYKFLESEGLYAERQKTDIRIMEIVFNS